MSKPNNNFITIQSDIYKQEIKQMLENISSDKYLSYLHELVNTMVIPAISEKGVSV